jgi:hypothetical protein
MGANDVAIRRVGLPGGIQPASADTGALRLEVALRAYYRYRDRGSVPGFEIEDWLAAEQEVLAQHANTTASKSGPTNSSAGSGRRAKRTPGRQ